MIDTEHVSQIPSKRTFALCLHVMYQTGLQPHGYGRHHVRKKLPTLSPPPHRVYNLRVFLFINLPQQRTATAGNAQSCHRASLAFPSHPGDI